MKNTVELMAQHYMKIEYAYSIHMDTFVVRASSLQTQTSVMECSQTEAKLAKATRICVRRLAEALK